MIIGNTIYRQKSCTNSMTWAREECFKAPDGTIFQPEMLTHANGRQGRQWHLAEGQLTKTILLKPELFATLSATEIAHHINLLGMALCLGILAPLLPYGITLKWPNDFIITNNKMGGMLLELVWLADKPYALILGFSLNINNYFTATHPLKNIATSLFEVHHTTLDLTNLEAQIITALDHYYEQWRNGNNEALFTEWKSHQRCIGTSITVHQLGGQIIHGIAKDITSNGDLILESNDRSITIPFFMVDSLQMTR